MRKGTRAREWGRELHELSTGDAGHPATFLDDVFVALRSGVHLDDSGGVGFKDPAFTGPGLSGQVIPLASQRRIVAVQPVHRIAVAPVLLAQPGAPAPATPSATRWR